MDLYGHFNRITKALDKNGLEVRVVGGIALAFYTRPRATVDVDLLVQPADVDSIVRVLAKLGYEQMSPPLSLARGRLRLTRLVYLKKTEHFIIDLLWSDKPPVAGIWKRRREFRYEGRTIRVMDPEGLIVLKKMRGSPQDRLDIGALREAVRRGKEKTKRG
ncbi:nucleotidyltransferase [bacterium]|nr:nucleotidyltransferase [bacterium]